ncbi:MAG: hypothetical protein ACREFD_02975 [Stellaceae bacterium]
MAAGSSKLGENDLMPMFKWFHRNKTTKERSDSQADWGMFDTPDNSGADADSAADNSGDTDSGGSDDFDAD